MVMKRLEYYEMFKMHRKSISDTSLNKTDNVNLICDNRLVVDFDDVKDDFLSGLGKRNEYAKSVDALYQDSGGIFFVEFKSGGFDNSEIKKKAYDSLIIFSNITKQDAEFIRNNVSFLLVISNSRYDSLSDKDKRAMALAAKGEQDFVIYGLDKMRGYMFKSVNCMSAFRYEKYIAKRDIMV